MRASEEPVLHDDAGSGRRTAVRLERAPRVARVVFVATFFEAVIKAAAVVHLPARMLRVILIDGEAEAGRAQ